MSFTVTYPSCCCGTGGCFCCPNITTSTALTGSFSGYSVSGTCACMNGVTATMTFGVIPFTSPAKSGWWGTFPNGCGAGSALMAIECDTTATPPCGCNYLITGRCPATDAGLAIALDPKSYSCTCDPFSLSVHVSFALTTCCPNSVTDYGTFTVTL